MEPASATATEPAKVVHPASSRPVACFDLDGTLVRGDTLLPFLATYAWKYGRRIRLLGVPFWLLLMAFRVVSARRAKEAVLTGVLKGEPLTRVQEHAEWFWNAWVRRRLKPEVLRCLEIHMEARDRVILVSASPDLYVPVFARHLGIREVLCTHVESTGGLCTGRILGENCKGVAKVQKLKAHLGSQNIPAGSSAYGDSSSDLPLLRAVANGYWVEKERVRAISAPVEVGDGNSGARSRWSAVLVPLACLMVWACFIPTTLDKARKYSWDSAAYVEGMQGILEGRGLVHRTIAGMEPNLWEPMAMWPPGYPILMAVARRLGASNVFAGVSVSLVAGALFVLLQAWICQRVLSWRFALPVSLAGTCMPALYQVSVNCLSDAAYMAASAGSLALLIRWATQHGPAVWNLFGAGFLAGGAWTIRNVGIALLAAAGLFVLARSLRCSWVERCRNLLAFGIGTAILVTPVLVRNWVVFGALNPYEMPPSERSLATNLTDTWSTLSEDLLPAERLRDLVLSRYSAMVSGVLLLIVGWFHRRSISLRSLREVIGRNQHLVLLGGYAFIFITMVVVARTKYRWGEVIYWRYLVPVFWIILLGAAAGLAGLFAKSKRSWGRMGVIAILWAAALLQARAQFSWSRQPADRLGSLEISVGAEVGQYLSASVPPHQIVLSCRADLLRIHCDLNARKIPSRPFRNFPLQREITAEAVHAALKSGVLWGVVLDDLPAVRQGHYGEWVRKLCEEPGLFPEFVLVTSNEQSMVFRHAQVQDSG